MPAFEAARRRGPHGWGVWADGTAVKGLGVPRELPTGEIVLTHARMASDGLYDDVSRLQPVSRRNLTMVYNGVCPAYDTTYESDTVQLLGSIAERGGMWITTAALHELLQDVGADRYALAFTDGRQVVLARRGLPLWLVVGDGWKVWSSVNWRSDALSLQDGATVVLS